MIPYRQKIIMIGKLSFNFYELPKVCVAFPATVAYKLYQSKIHFYANQEYKN